MPMSSQQRVTHDYSDTEKIDFSFFDNAYWLQSTSNSAFEMFRKHFEVVLVFFTSQLCAMLDFI